MSAETRDPHTEPDPSDRHEGDEEEADRQTPIRMAEQEPHHQEPRESAHDEEPRGRRRSRSRGSAGWHPRSSRFTSMFSGVSELMGDHSSVLGCNPGGDVVLLRGWKDLDDPCSFRAIAVLVLDDLPCELDLSYEVPAPLLVGRPPSGYPLQVLHRIEPACIPRPEPRALVAAAHPG